MTPDRWRQIENLYHAAQGCHPNDRAALLECTDPEIRSRVERMLALDCSGQILDRPAASLLDSPTEIIVAGAQLGPYKIESLIGAGGMGAVYRAVDTRLDRKVAIKVCAEHFTAGFDREARALAALNHPHICTLFDVGPDYLVMELIEGPTLAERIRERALEPADLLRLGAQIADALAEAHAAGIVHLDLKPGNIMLTGDNVKVLDFGLAKTSTDAGGIPTQALMGTLAYMAPEQLEDEEADARSDLFALGLVLYEMASGQLPFPGSSLSSMLITGTAETFPPHSRIQPGLPAGLDALIARLLEKDPAQRPQSAAEVRDELQKLARTPRSNRKAIVAAAALLLLAAGGFWMAHRPLDESANLGQVTQITPVTSYLGDEREPSLSPDGNQVAFSWDSERGDNRDIYVTKIGEQTPLRLTHDPAVDDYPAWSPNGKQIAFLRQSDARRWDIDIISSQGGPERTLHETQFDTVALGDSHPLLAWTPDSKEIVFPQAAQETGSRLYVLSLETGLTRLLDLGDLQGSLGDSSPAISPNGQWLAFRRYIGPNNGQLMVEKLSPGIEPVGDPMAVPGSLPNPTSPWWSPDSKRLIFANRSRVLAWRIGGTARPIYTLNGALPGLTAAWPAGNLRAVVTSHSQRSDIWALPLDPATHHPTGTAVRRAPSSALENMPRLSPDGSRLAFLSSRSGSEEVWLADAEGATPRQLTHLGAYIVGFPRWSADGKRIAFHARVPEVPQIYVVDTDGAGLPRKITNTQLGLAGPAWMMDGEHLLAWQNINGQGTVFRVRVAGGFSEQLFEGAVPVSTPDGKRVLYGKVSEPGIFARSLEGDPSRNVEERLVDDFHAGTLGGMLPLPSGIYYVGSTPSGQPRAFRFFDYATRRISDIAPTPSRLGVGLTVSPDQRQLLYAAFNDASGDDLLLLEFH